MIEPVPVGPDIRVLRGTKGRVTGWLVYCDKDGYIGSPAPVKRHAERAAIAHGNTVHQGNARVRVPI